jgi:hypothetical protein|tara:strand:+ start:2379 stop:3602 length:1224 start_codon:yes stop_codon:yes gene_type:complete
MGNPKQKKVKTQGVIDLNPKIDKLQYPLFAIGTKYYQQEKEGVLHTTSIQIQRDKYGRKLSKEITYCIGFTNEPSHNDYKSIVDNKYNVYKKLTHVPIKGEWPIIKSFLRHIFGRQYEMGVEYFWNLYHHPKQKLPFIGVVSEEKNTGKSTFLNFIRMVFQENVSTVSEHDFKSNFNSGFVNSLVCTSDEHAEGKNRTLIAQKLKMYITEKQIRVEAKGRDAYTTSAYFKLVFAGNNESTLTFIEDENTRYWVIKVDPLEKLVNDMEGKLEKEIPYFLYYLINEFVARPSRGRLYFDPSEFQTEASKLIQENSKSAMQRDIEDLVQTCFDDDEHLTKVYFAPIDIVISLELKAREKAYVKQVLQKEMKLKPCESSIRYRVSHPLNMITKSGTPYLFKRELFDKSTAF